MPSYPQDWKTAQAIEIEVRADLDAGMREAARLSEFTTGTEGNGLAARKPLTNAEIEVAVALNVIDRLLNRRVSEVSGNYESQREGLDAAATMLTLELARRDLPQLPPEGWP